MEIKQTNISGCKIIEPIEYKDNRGFFLETFQKNRYKDLAGIDYEFVQDNHSRSSKNVLRGLHFQKENPQGKLIRVPQGTVLDVVVDIRKNSKTYGNWISVVISGENKTQLWIPPGLAHGFLVLSDFADFEYKCTDYFDSSDEYTILWNDPDLKIKWGIENPIISLKDSNGLYFKDL